MFFCDSHVHLCEFDVDSLISKSSPGERVDSFSLENYRCCSSCLSKDEFLSTQKIAASLKKNDILISFGIHPQNVNYCDEELSFLEKIARNRKINAVGEIGFDFFTQEFKETAPKQKKIFDAQLEIALENKLPVVLHVRKAMDVVFSYSSLLKKLPSVVFHSFPGTYEDASSILRKGINAYFSFGTPLLRGKKSNICCVKNLPDEVLLFETDAPFQTLKGKTRTEISDIAIVYENAMLLKKGVEKADDDFFETVEENFKRAFCTVP